MAASMTVETVYRRIIDETLNGVAQSHLGTHALTILMNKWEARLEADNVLGHNDDQMYGRGHQGIAAAPPLYYEEPQRGRFQAPPGQYNSDVAAAANVAAAVIPPHLRGVMPPPYLHQDDGEGDFDGVTATTSTTAAAAAAAAATTIPRPSVTTTTSTTTCSTSIDEEGGSETLTREGEALAPPFVLRGQVDGDSENEELGSDLDDPNEEEGNETFDMIVCQFEKVTRTKNKWKVILKAGIAHIDGRDLVFQKCTGDFEW